MKKILCLILAIACIFAISSCGAKNKDYEDIVKDSNPTKITTIVDYVGEDTLRSIYVTEIDYENEKSKVTYERQRYGRVLDGEKDYIVTDTGEVLFKDGTASADGGESWETASATTYHFELKLNKRYFKTYELSEDGTTVTATVAPENVEIVFGEDIATEGDVSVKVVTVDSFLYSIDVSYTAASGATVVVKTSYTYNPVTLDF